MQEDIRIEGLGTKADKNGKVLVKKEISGYENLSRLLQFSVSFFVLFCAYFTIQNMAAFVMQDDSVGDYGFYSLAVLYAS